MAPSIALRLAMVVVLTSSALAVRLQTKPEPKGCDGGYDAPSYTNCPNTKYIDDMVRADDSPDKIILDVGCNKGDDAIEWLERWGQPGSPWSKKAWVDAYAKHKVTRYACRTPHFDIVRASDQPGQNHSLGKGPKVICVEPARANFGMLETVGAELGYVDHDSFEIVRAAMTGTAEPGSRSYFPDMETGAEGGHLHKERDWVNLTTVDMLATEMKLPRVDILTIDTEGWDPEVLAGASQTLAHVRYLEFEVHRDFKSSPWGNTTLRSVIDNLDSLAFDCYWAGNNGILISLLQCWSEKFERGSWSNVACVRRGDRWAPILKKYAVPK